MWKGKEIFYNRAVVASPFVGSKLIFAFRLFATIFLGPIVLTILVFSYSSLAFFTDWGLIFTFISFLLMTIAHFKERKVSGLFTQNPDDETFY